MRSPICDRCHQSDPKFLLADLITVEIDSRKHHTRIAYLCLDCQADVAEEIIDEITNGS